MEEFEEIIKNAKAYTLSTKINIFVINNKGKIIYPDNVTSFPHAFCRLIQDKYLKEEECCYAHIYGSYQAERFGEAYIFFCPYGLVHWAAPIIQDYRIIYSLIAGPVLMTTPDNTLIRETLDNKGFAKKEINDLYQELYNISIIEPQEVNHLAILLFAVASYLSGMQVKTLTDNKEYFMQQDSIGDTLHSIKQHNSNEKSYPLDKEKELLTKIRQGDKAGAQKLLNELLGYIFFAQGNNLELIRTKSVELIVMLSRAALEAGADDENIYSLNYKYLQELNCLQNIDDIAFWLSKVMSCYIDNIFNLNNVKNIDIIYKAISYLQENYMKDITLNEVAKYVNLSHAYFSKIFKEEMKNSFTNYLNGVRIEKSKQFLLNEDIPLIEIAGMVGFEDQSYFSKVFKKITNISPGEFRKLRGAPKKFR